MHRLTNMQVWSIMHLQYVLISSVFVSLFQNLRLWGSDRTREAKITKTYSLTKSNMLFLLATSVFLSDLQLGHYSNIVVQSRF